VDRILKKLADEGNAPDFVLCIGDDRSDEDMFIAMEHVTFSPHLTTEVIATRALPWPCLCFRSPSYSVLHKLHAIV